MIADERMDDESEDNKLFGNDEVTEEEDTAGELEGEAIDEVKETTVEEVAPTKDEGGTDDEEELDDSMEDDG